jgi:hypothetical protein
LRRLKGIISALKLNHHQTSIFKKTWKKSYNLQLVRGVKGGGAFLVKRNVSVEIV